MPSIVPKAKTANASFDGCYTAIVAKGGTSAVENKISTYGPALLAIQTQTLKAKFEESETENGVITRIFYDVEIPKEKEGIPITAAGSTAGLAICPHIGTLSIANNVTHIDVLGSATDKKIAKRVVIGEGITAAGNSLNYITVTDEAILNFSTLTNQEMGNMYDGATVRLPKLTTGDSFYMSSSGALYRANLAPDSVPLAVTLRGKTAYGGWQRFNVNGTVFSSLQTVKGTLFSACSGTAYFPVLTEVKNADFTYQVMFTTDCTFTDVYIGPDLATIDGTNEATFKTNLPNAGTTIHIPAGDNATKAKFDALSVPYVQDYVIGGGA